MKALLTKTWDEDHWIKTFDLRKAELSEDKRIVSQKMNWPFLFTHRGVINV